MTGSYFLVSWAAFSVFVWPSAVAVAYSSHNLAMCTKWLHSFVNGYTKSGTLQMPQEYRLIKCGRYKLQKGRKIPAKSNYSTPARMNRVNETLSSRWRDCEPAASDPIPWLGILCTHQSCLFTSHGFCSIVLVKYLVCDEQMFAFVSQLKSVQ